MMLPMNGFEAPERKVCVDLSRRDVGVSQESLHGSEIGAPLYHVGGTAMAQHVRARGLVALFHQMPDPLARERPAACG